MNRLHHALAALALGVLTWPAHAADGEQWEYTGQVDAGGMKIAMPPTKTCVKAGTTPQPQMDKGCTVDNKLGPTGGTFTFKCPPPNAMDGQGEMKFGADTMSATLQAKSEGRTVLIQQSGRKTGRCNAG